MSETFKYRASDQAGKISTGTITADSRELVVNVLREQGFVPLAVDLQRQGVKREIRLTGLVEAVHSSKILVPQIFGPGGHKLDDKGIDVTNIFDPASETFASGLPDTIINELIADAPADVPPITPPRACSLRSSFSTAVPWYASVRRAWSLGETSSRISTRDRFSVDPQIFFGTKDELAGPDVKKTVRPSRPAALATELVASKSK